MYIEDLVTPHPKTTYPGVVCRPFIEEAQLREAPALIAAAEDPAEQRRTMIARMQSLGRKALRFPDKYTQPKSKGETTFETLRDEGITDCLGYTAVASEAFTMAEIDHYIGYANRHWFVLRKQETRMNMYDMLSPVFNQDITPMLERGDPQTISAQVDASGRGAAMFDTQKLQAKAHMTLEEMDDKYPWITIAKEPPTADNHRHTDDDTRSRREHTLVLSVFDAEIGMQVMHDYAYFRSALNRMDLGAAALRLQNMRGLYPEIDARASHEEIRKLIKCLCATGEFDTALQSAQDYASSFALSNDPRLKELEGDMFRYICKASKNPELALRAQEAYQEAANRSKYASGSDLFSSKAAVSRSLRTELVA